MPSTHKIQNDDGKMPPPPDAPGSSGGISADYELRILRSVRRIIRAIDIHSSKLLREHNMTPAQLICLYCLAEESALTLSALAKGVNLSLSTTTGIVDRLEAKGWVRRERDTGDRRKVSIQLTEGGRGVVQSAPSLLQDRFSEGLGVLPELEQAAIALSLERVVELMEAERLDASPNLLPSGAIVPEEP